MGTRSYSMRLWPVRLHRLDPRDGQLGAACIDRDSTAAGESDRDLVARDGFDPAESPLGPGRKLDVDLERAQQPTQEVVAGWRSSQADVAAAAVGLVAAGGRQRRLGL